MLTFCTWFCLCDLTRSESVRIYVSSGASRRGAEVKTVLEVPVEVEPSFDSLHLLAAATM